MKSLSIPDFLSLSYSPAGFAFNPQGDLLVSEFHFGKILTFDIETDQYTGLFADLGMSTIRDIDFGPDGNLYAAHTDGHAATDHVIPVSLRKCLVESRRGMPTGPSHWRMHCY